MYTYHQSVPYYNEQYSTVETVPQIVYCLLTHPLKDSWVLSSFGLLGIKLLQTTVYQFYVNLIFISAAQTGKWGLLSHMATVSPAL